MNESTAALPYSTLVVICKQRNSQTHMLNDDRMSPVTLVHLLKPLDRMTNEMSFGRDTRVVPSNTVLDRVPGLHGKRRFGDHNPSSQRCCLSPDGHRPNTQGVF